MLAYIFVKSLLCREDFIDWYMLEIYLHTLYYIGQFHICQKYVGINSMINSIPDTFIISNY